MATTVFDLTEDSINGAYSGWIVQANGGGAGSRVEPDATVLIPGMLTLKATVVNGSLDPVTGNERADAYYNGGAGPSPAGGLGIAAGATQWWRWAQKTGAYVPLNDGITPSFNSIGGEFHNSGGGPQANIQVCVNAVTGNVEIWINGGIAANYPTLGTNRINPLFTFVAGDLFDFILFVFWATDGTGVTKIWCSRNGGAYTQVVNDTGANLWVGEGAYPKMSNYRRQSSGGATNVVYYTGLIRGDKLSDLAVPGQGGRTIGLSTLTGLTASACVAASKRGSPVTFTEDGEITHLSAYITVPGTSSGKVSNLFAVYADAAGAPGAKLAQSREFIVYDAAAAVSAWYTAELAAPLRVTKGTTYWLVWGQGFNGSKVSYNTQVVGVATTFSNSDTYTAVGGLTDPAGTNTTGSPNRTILIQAYYRPLRKKRRTMGAG